MIFFLFQTTGTPVVELAAAAIDQAAKSPNLDRWSELAIAGFISAAVAAVFTWLLTGKKTESETRKNNSDVDLNESEIIQNLVNIIGKLQTDIDSFIERTKGLRVQVDAAEDAKRQADLLIEQVRRDEADKTRELHRAFAAEKAKLAESVITMQMIINNIATEIADCPNNSELKREAVRISELLHYVRGKLTS
jgi:hypothetical protein